MRTFLIVSLFLFFLYTIKKPLIGFVKFIFDNFIGEIFLRLGEWIEPLILTFTNLKDSFVSKLNPRTRVLGSIFLFLITITLSILNYYLIYYGMELLLSKERELGAFGFSPAGLASIVMMLTEVGLGFLMLEVLGITDLLEWHKWKMSRRIGMGIILFIFLGLVVGVEISTALKRIYEIEESSAASVTGFEKFMRDLPYLATGLLTFVIPFYNALSAYSLRDILVLIGVTFFILLIVFLNIVNIIHKRLYYFITHIDDFLEAILKILIYPVELIISGVLYLLIRLKIIKPFSVIIFIILSFFSLGYSQELTKDFQSHKLVIVLMDISGSFNKYRSRAVDHCIKYLEEAEKKERENPYVIWNGDIFILFVIKEESLSREKPPLVKLVIPLSPTKIETRKFREEKMRRIKEAKKQLISIKKLPSSRYTDIAGAISRVSMIFNSDQYRNFQKFLLIYSDMRNNIKRKLLDVNLRDVCVKILFADITEKTKGDIEYWKDILLKQGAKEVKVYTPDECEIQVDFGLECKEGAK